jgi:hypothetical protein
VTAVAIAFWAALALLLHAHVVYPLVLWALARRSPGTRVR